MPQTLPFAEEELRAAFVQVMSEAEAKERAAQIATVNAATEGHTLTISEPTLDLLSRVSPELATRVETFRAQRRQAIAKQREYRMQEEK